jgi:polyhydroxyalkanoate synthesis regulator protein
MNYKQLILLLCAFLLIAYMGVRITQSSDPIKVLSDYVSTNTPLVTQLDTQYQSQVHWAADTLVQRQKLSTSLEQAKKQLIILQEKQRLSDELKKINVLSWL